MAKRFTDTGKWSKASFSELSSKMKLVWIYLCDNCDHAGVWDINEKLLSFHLGESVTVADIQEGLGDKIKVLVESGKLFLPTFVEFQYGDLNPDNRVHKSVLSRLEKVAPYKGLIRPLEGSKDMEQEKCITLSLERGSGGKPLKSQTGKLKAELSAHARSVYERYPRKEGKKAGLTKLEADLRAGALPDDIHRSLDNFIAHHKSIATEPKFLPYFSTWVGFWRDCLDPDYGKTESFASAQSQGLSTEHIKRVLEGGA